MAEQRMVKALKSMQCEGLGTEKKLQTEAQQTKKKRKRDHD